MAPSKQRSGGDARPLGILDTGMVRRGDPTSMTRPEPGTNTRTSRGYATRTRTAAHRWRAVCRSRCDGRASGGRVRVASEPPPRFARFTATSPTGPLAGARWCGLRRQRRRGHDVRPESSPPRSARKGVPVAASLGAVGLPSLRRSPVGGVQPPIELRASAVRCGPAGESHPRAQPRLSGHARSSPYRLVCTPTATVRTHDGPVPREGPGGGCLGAAASAAPRVRRRDDGREAPGREAQESNGHGAPATEGHRNGRSYGARP